MVWAAAAIAYLIGSVPFGVIVARAYGVDLRAKGSGNIGATNALRVIGKKAGVLTLAGDVLKGVIAVYLAVLMAGAAAGPVAAAAAVLGHDFSVFTGFKGGKGVATTFGVVFALAPLAAFVTFIAWLVTVAVWKYSSLGAVVSFSLLPVIVRLTRPGEGDIVVLSLFLTALALIKHRANIARLIRGEEPRIGAKTA